MACKDGYCEIEVEPKPCPTCNRFPVAKVNNLTAWLKCPVCGRCAIGGNKREAIKNWNRKDRR